MSYDTKWFFELWWTVFWQACCWASSTTRGSAPTTSSGPWSTGSSRTSASSVSSGTRGTREKAFVADQWLARLLHSQEVEGSNLACGLSQKINLLQKQEPWLGRLHSTEETFLILIQQHRVWFLAFPKIYFDVAEIYRQCWLEESGQRLENVDQTRLVLASGKIE